MYKSQPKMNAETDADTERVTPLVQPPTIQSLLPRALERPDAEGARIVALWWFEQLQQARHELPGGGALQHAGVAVERLRWTLREHAEVLGDARIKRERRHLRTLARVLHDACEGVAQQEWLHAEAPLMTADAAAEAAEVIPALAESSAEGTQAVAGAFATHLDSVQESLPAALMHFTVHGSLERAASITAFSTQLAQRLQRDVASLLRAVEALKEDDGKQTLRRVETQVDRLRAMLSPFVPEVHAFETLYQTATRARQLLTSMRFAKQLAKRAKRAGFAHLTSALEAAGSRYQNEFAVEWLQDGGARALGGAEAAHGALERWPTQAPQSIAQAVSRATVPLEIERKYLLRGCPPEAAVVAGIRIEQGWIPGQALCERLRSSTYPTGVSRYTRTVKFGEGIARVELEEDTDRKVFETLWPLTVAARVTKRRHAIREGAFTWEIDVFTDRELVLAEVELQSADDAPPIPSWLERWVVREVTGEAEYINANLAVAGVGEVATTAAPGS